MPLISVSDLRPGMKLTNNVFSKNGSILLTAGTVVTDKHIRRLHYFEVRFVEVENNIYEIEISKDEEIYNCACNCIKNLMKEAVDGKQLNEKQILDTVGCIIDYICDDERAFNYLTGIRDKDNYTFLHSVDVCVYSLITGKNLDFSKEELFELGIAALLHDIGKCHIPSNILAKPGRLTNEEFAIIKKHPLYGYNIITNQTTLNNKIATIILQHHEKCDGSGYPLGLKGHEIHKYARIIAIADIYDALTADRVYKKRILPHEAIEYIIGNSNTLLDHDLVKTFIENITIYPKGTKVLLNTGEIGEVIGTNKNLPYRPTVKVLNHIDINKRTEPHVLDLIEYKNIFIEDIIKI